MLPVAVRASPKQESVSLETTRKTVQHLTRELALVLEDPGMTPTRVEIMDTIMESKDQSHGVHLGSVEWNLLVHNCTKRSTGEIKMESLLTIFDCH